MISPVWSNFLSALEVRRLGLNDDDDNDDELI